MIYNPLVLGGLDILSSPDNNLRHRRKIIKLRQGEKFLSHLLHSQCQTHQPSKDQRRYQEQC